MERVVREGPGDRQLTEIATERLVDELVRRGGGRPAALHLNGRAVLDMTVEGIRCFLVFPPDRPHAAGHSAAALPPGAATTPGPPAAPSPPAAPAAAAAPAAKLDTGAEIVPAATPITPASIVPELPIGAGRERLELSPRELEIARLVALGHTNRMVAYELVISLWTVSAHLRRIYAKLGVSTRAAMVAALAADLLTEHDLQDNDPNEHEPGEHEAGEHEAGEHDPPEVTP
jgi:DNA-binding CsgD family transcriptional regulator